MKKKHFKFVAVVLVTALLQFSFSPFVFQVYAKGQVVIAGEAGKAQVTVNGKSFPLKTGLQIKDGMHVIRLKKDVFTTLGINYSEWDMGNTIFVGLKYGGHAVILEIVRGRSEILVKADGNYVDVSPSPTLAGGNVFVPLEPLYQMLGFSVAGGPEKIVEKQKPKTEKTPVLQPELLFETATMPKVKAEPKTELLPASGKIKKLPQSGQVAITLNKGTGAKVGEVLYITRNEQPVATVKVVKAGAGWCVAKILSVEKGGKIKSGDGVSVMKPEVAKIPTPVIEKPTVTPIETKPEITKKPEIPTTPVAKEETTEKPEEITNVSVTKEGEKKPAEKKQTLDEILNEMQGKKTEAEAPKILAIMDIENLSKITDSTLIKKAADVLIESLLKTQRFTLVEREKIAMAVFELKLQQTDYFKPENAKKIGEFLGADLLGAGTVKSVSLLGKAENPTGALVELSIRIFETTTGKLLYALSAVGKSEGEGSSDYHIGQALQRASGFITQKLPGEVTIISTLSGMTEANMGTVHGVEKNHKLVVKRNGNEIGGIEIKKLLTTSLEGTFKAKDTGVLLKQGDQVFNVSVKDDTPSKKSKGGLGGSTLLIGVLAVGLLAALAGGGGKGGGGDNGGGGGGTTTTIVPPGPPSE